MKSPRVEMVPSVRQPRCRRQQFWLTLLVAGLVLGSGGCGGRLASIIWGKGSAVAVRPASGDSTRLLRNAHYFKLMGRMDLALKELEEAYQIEPQNPKVANALAQCCDELGEGERARGIYEKALAQDSGNPGLSNNLCFSYYQAGKWQQAEACFRETLARNPNNVAARNNLGLVLVRQGRREEARRLWREAEGEGVAEGKVKQALAALGLEGSINKAAAPPPAIPKAVARNSQGGSPPVPPGLAAAAPPQPPKPVATAPPSPQRPVTGSPPKAPKPEATQVQAAAQPASTPPSAPPKATSPTTKAEVSPGSAPLKRPQLTKEELAETAIELRNGNGLKGIARKAGEILSLDGFKVAVIGDHTDSEMQQTAIYYRPGEEKVARVLQEKFFRTAKLEEKPALTNVGVKVIMGHDVVKQREFADWAVASAPPVTNPPAAKPRDTSATTKAAVSPEPAPQKRPQLTKEELAETAIELRNGNGLHDLAHKAREMLSQDGFQVKIIGNHIDFGMEQTTIYYRPRAEKVAWVLQDKFFRTAKLEEKPSMAKADVKVVMGHDLAKDLEVVALAGERGRP